MTENEAQLSRSQVVIQQRRFGSNARRSEGRKKSGRTENEIEMERSRNTNKIEKMKKKESDKNCTDDCGIVNFEGAELDWM